MLDTLIKGAQIIDGSGAAAYTGDLALEGGRIVGMGQLGQPAARRTVNADGLVAAPGFIDMHSHSDFTILANPRAESSVHQGVTTEVLGNCGFSPAPVNPATLDDLKNYTAALSPGLPWDWSTLGDYLDAVRRGGTAINLVPLVGQGVVRIAAMGFGDRAPTPTELEAMRVLVAQAMQDGAWGLSTGLIYPPGVYTGLDEIVALMRVATRYGGMYCTHIRGESETLLPSVDEALEVGERTGAAVHISHLKAAGAAQWGKIKDAAAHMDRARASGRQVTGDFYPYLAGSTLAVTLLPPWAHDGGIRETLARLRQPEPRARMRHEMQTGLPGWQNLYGNTGGWENVMIVAVQSERNRGNQGLRVGDHAKRVSKDPFDAFFDLLLEEEGSVMVVVFMMSDDDVKWLMRYPYAAVGSDGLTFAPYGAMGQMRVHPRYFGTFARVLGHYSRQEQAVPLAEAVRKMTGLPAGILGLADRGLLRAGMVADVVLFDASRVIDQATYAEPHRYPDGVELVLVGGQVVVEHGEHTGALPGAVLARPAAR